jgi:hypothetical protein
VLKNHNQNHCGRIFLPPTRFTTVVRLQVITDDLPNKELRLLLMKLTDAKLVKKLVLYAIGPYPEPDESNPRSPNLFPLDPV